MHRPGSQEAAPPPSDTSAPTVLPNVREAEYVSAEAAAYGAAVVDGLTRGRMARQQVHAMHESQTQQSARVVQGIVRGKRARGDARAMELESPSRSSRSSSKERADAAAAAAAALVEDAEAMERSACLIQGVTRGTQTRREVGKVREAEEERKRAKLKALEQAVADAAARRKKEADEARAADEAASQAEAAAQKAAAAEL